MISFAPFYYLAMGFNNCILSLVNWFIAAYLFLNVLLAWQKVTIEFYLIIKLQLKIRHYFVNAWKKSKLQYYLLFHLQIHRFSNKTFFLAVVDPQRDWTPHRLEMCLWAMTVARQLQLPALQEVDVKAGGAAKKSADADASHRPIKKLKTKWK